MKGYIIKTRGFEMKEKKSDAIGGCEEKKVSEKTGSVVGRKDENRANWANRREMDVKKKTSL